MYIKKLRIDNYKSFWKSDWIEFEPGFNLIVGQNDAGKTALLEALQAGMDAKPHRSLLTAPEIRTPDIPTSSSEKELHLEKEDIRKYLIQQEQIGIREESGNPSRAIKDFLKLVERPVSIRARWSNLNVKSAWLASKNEQIQTTWPTLQIKNKGWPLSLDLGDHIGTGSENFEKALATQCGRDIYLFKAERYRVGSCAANGRRELAPDASNLPEVLNKLTDDPATEQELHSHIRTIFPHITHVTSALENGTTAHIRVWTQPVETKRRDLAISLSDSGSGIGQVLAMLYVVVTADRPKVILIDEPQSFLHPGAVRKLFEILGGYSHQYVVTTHAPTGLNITKSTNMLMVKRGANESTVLRLDTTKQSEVRVFLTEVGTKLGDLFGADNVLWVEGKTEETCFPLLIRDVAGKRLGGTQILGVVNTGDFEGELAEKVVTLYQRLVEGPTVLPPAVAFVFDLEGRTVSQRADIEKRARGLVQWLPRRMFENYLIQAEPISKVINAEDFERPVPLQAGEVKAWLEINGSRQEFFPKSTALPYSDENWEDSVHGAKVLNRMFNELSSARVQYDKVRHGELLTRELVAEPTNALKELAEMLAGLCK